MPKHDTSLPMDLLARTIDIHAPYPALQYTEASIRELFLSLDTWGAYAIASGDVSVALLDDAQIAEIHASFLDDPTPTDVITFPGDDAMGFAGEICISIDHAQAASQEHNTPFEREVCLYLVHGWLHLAGLNDTNEEEKALMRQAEQGALAHLSKNQPLPRFKILPLTE